MEDYMIEFLPKLGVKLDSEISILMGMNISEVKTLLGKADHEKYYYNIFPYKKYEERKIYYSKYLLVLTFNNDILEFIEFSPKVIINFKRINLSNMDYKETIKKVESMGYKCNFRKDNDSYEFDDVNLCIYTPSDELETIAIYRDNYFNDMYKIFDNFDIETKKENGIEKTYYTPK
jgi:hypothetical protein